MPDAGQYDTLVATSATDWQLIDLDLSFDYSEKPVPSASKIHRRAHYTITRMREVERPTIFAPDTGNVKTWAQILSPAEGGEGLAVGGTTVSMAFTATQGGEVKVICAKDTLKATEGKAGFAMQTQVWEHYGSLTEYDVSALAAS